MNNSNSKKSIYKNIISIVFLIILIISWIYMYNLFNDSITQLDEKIEEQELLIDHQKEKIETLTNQNTDLNKQMQKQQEKIDNKQEEIQEQEKKIQKKDNEISNLEAKKQESIKTLSSNTDDDTVRELNMTATAYTAYCEGCSGTTRTGINLRANPDKKVIAVDPNVIPLGSKVWVEGYGHAIAGDIGGAIKGKKIDVFIPKRSDALTWGVQNVKVKVY
jgi:3D (Asp-Asp-Asp) domain-containing protein